MIRNKVIVVAFCTTIVLGSCGTYAGSGAYTGASLGSILGSAVGEITGGYHGSNVGTIIGMAGGAIIGSAIGQKVDEQRAEDWYKYRRDKEQRAYERAQHNRYDNQQNNHSDNQHYPSDNDPILDESNGGDDRLYDFTGEDYTGNYTAQPPTPHKPAQSSVEQLVKGLDYTPHIEIKNARFVDENQDNVISRNELCKVIFEIYNRGVHTLYDIQPTVIAANYNKNLYISPSMHIEKLEPGAGIRYTAVVKADNRLKNGHAKICVSVIQANKAISKVIEFNIPTRKK